MLRRAVEAKLGQALIPRSVGKLSLGECRLCCPAGQSKRSFVQQLPGFTVTHERLLPIDRSHMRMSRGGERTKMMLELRLADLKFQCVFRLTFAHAAGFDDAKISKPFLSMLFSTEVSDHVHCTFTFSNDITTSMTLNMQSPPRTS